MEEKEKNFYPLCGKTKNEPLKLVTLAFVEETKAPVTVAICKGCIVIIHNIRRIYEDVKRKAIKNQSILGGEEVPNAKDTKS